MESQTYDSHIQDAEFYLLQYEKSLGDETGRGDHDLAVGHALIAIAHLLRVYIER